MFSRGKPDKVWGYEMSVLHYCHYLHGASQLLRRVTGKLSCTVNSTIRDRARFGSDWELSTDIENVPDPTGLHGTSHPEKEGPPL